MSRATLGKGMNAVIKMRTDGGLIHGVRAAGND